MSLPRKSPNYSYEEDLAKRNEEWIKKSFLKVEQNKNGEMRFLGIQELRFWATQENVDKCKLAESLIEICARVQDLFFKRMILDLICSDFRKYIISEDYKSKNKL